MIIYKRFVYKQRVFPRFEIKQSIGFIKMYVLCITDNWANTQIKRSE